MRTTRPMFQRAELQAEVPERVQVFTGRIGRGLLGRDHKKGAQFGRSEGGRRIQTGGCDAISSGADRGTVSSTSRSSKSKTSPRRPPFQITLSRSRQKYHP